jgi:hypothetical protein
MKTTGKTRKYWWIGGALWGLFWLVIDSSGVSWMKDLFLVVVGIGSINCMLLAIHNAGTEPLSKPDRGEER